MSIFHKRRFYSFLTANGSGWWAGDVMIGLSRGYSPRMARAWAWTKFSIFLYENYILFKFHSNLFSRSNYQWQIALVKILACRQRRSASSELMMASVFYWYVCVTRLPGVDCHMLLSWWTNIVPGGHTCKGPQRATSVALLSLPCHQECLQRLLQNTLCNGSQIGLTKSIGIKSGHPHISWHRWQLYKPFEWKLYRRVLQRQWFYLTSYYWFRWFWCKMGDESKNINPRFGIIINFYLYHYDNHHHHEIISSSLLMSLSLLLLLMLLSLSFIFNDNITTIRFATTFCSLNECIYIIYHTIYRYILQWQIRGHRNRSVSLLVQRRLSFKCCLSYAGEWLGVGYQVVASNNDTRQERGLYSDVMNSHSTAGWQMIWSRLLLLFAGNWSMSAYHHLSHLRQCSCPLTARSVVNTQTGLIYPDCWCDHTRYALCLFNDTYIDFPKQTTIFISDYIFEDCSEINIPVAWHR